MARVLRPIAGADSDTIAGRLLDEFSSLASLLGITGTGRLAQAGGEAVSSYVHHLRELLLYALKPRELAEPIVSDAQRLIEYLTLAQGHEQIEVMRVLYLDSTNRLIRDEVASRGTVDEAPCYRREIIRRALDLGATALILVHNHPSGDPTPSARDIEITRQVVRSAREFGITVHDHVIVSPSGWTSFRAERRL